MKSMLVYLLLSAISAEVFCGVFVDPYEFPTESMKNQNANENLEMMIAKITEKLEKLMELENCRQFGNESYILELINIVSSHTLSGIQNCQEHPEYIGKFIPEIKFNEKNKSEDFAEMEMEKFIAKIGEMHHAAYSIAENSPKCIKKQLDIFELSMNDLTLKVNQCSQDNISSIKSIIEFCSRMTKTFKLIIDINSFQYNFTTILRNRMRHEMDRINGKFFEAMNDIEVSSTNEECSQSGIDKLFNSLGSSLQNTECIRESTKGFHAVKIVHEKFNKIKVKVLSFTEFYKRRPYEFDIASDKIFQNIDELQIIANTLKNEAEKLSFYLKNGSCFRRNQENFRLSINHIKTEIEECSYDSVTTESYNEFDP